MAVPERQRLGKKSSFQEVYSDVHKSRPCTSCTLCKEKSIKYTHPVKWKDENLLKFLQSIEPDLNILPDACICRNCRDSLSNGRKKPNNYKPRWSRVAPIIKPCEVSGCIEPACRCTKLATKEEITQHLQCPLDNLENFETNLCDNHYRNLHKQISPASYQWKCGVCSIAIRGGNYQSFRACAEPELFTKHLREHTDHDVGITGNEKVCMECYRHSLTVAREAIEKPTTTDDEFKCLIDTIKGSLSTLQAEITNEQKLIDYVLKLTTVAIAQQLLNNQALTLNSAYDIFKSNVESLLPMSTSDTPSKIVRSPRWLLCQLSLLLNHHLAYTCRVKKHGTILYRQGRELDCLSHSLFSLKNLKSDFNKPKYMEVCSTLNSRLHSQANKCKLSEDLLNIEQQIQTTDPVLWDMICVLTQSTRERINQRHSQVYEGNIKNLRRLFILHQIMFCIDNTCSVPFHILTADLIDCHGGSSELIKVFNRLGVCVSSDTLLRHIQGTTQRFMSNGLLQDMNCNLLTVFTVDNIDFMHSYSQVFSGNQQLSWHGTTLQAVQCKPSLDKLYSNKGLTPGARRTHALLSPVTTPEKDTRSPLPKRSRARTGTEFSLPSLTASDISYDFTLVTTTKPDPLTLSIENFRVTVTESIKVLEFLAHATSYCLLQNGIQEEQQLLGLQSFFSIATKASKPEVGIVKYVQVLDEVADSKDTILHVISELHAEYISKHNHKYLVLEGDAKTYEIIQAIKHEYGQDLSWLIPYPGDWHLLKNYQHCLMKPFFEAGLRDLAVSSSYPSQSIQSCSQFKRTHYFLMEVWEAMYRSMLESYLDSLPNKQQLEQCITSTLLEFTNVNYDELALYSVIRSFEEERNTFDEKFSRYVQEMSNKDDTWKFWSRFVFEDCRPYISLFIAIRSENWHLRMASVKAMAADFTAFDHPIYQKLISQHIVDVLNMPADLVKYFENGGFVLSISGNVLHSVALDESHEMLINKHVKQAIVRPSKDYINRITRYIPFRVKSMENFKAQVFSKQVHSTSRISPVMFIPDQSDIKSATNIKCMLQQMKDYKLFPYSIPLNRGLVNPFRGLVATTAQNHDLLQFREIGRENFELRIKAYILKNPSVKVPQRRKKLQTFATSKKGFKRQTNAAQQELKRVQKCMRKKIAHANKSGSNPDVVGQQYIEYPRALCTIDGLPVKGQKSIATKFYQARYKDADVITHTFPNDWIADSVILEGMFLINTKPLHCHKIMEDYGNFMMRRFIVPYLKKGSQEVHLLFDDPGRQAENPKQFEQSRRDTSFSDHNCFIFFDDAEVPIKWQNTIKCRMCKRRLTTYLSGYFVRKIRPFLTESQKFVTSGATDNFNSVVVTNDTGACMWSTIESRVDESDTRLWLHLRYSAGTKKFILSPDTDVYHIGLPLVTPEESVIVQLSRPSDKELKLLNVNILIDLLKRDPDIVHIPEINIPRVLQTLFVCTGCDYVSFFAGIGKAFFLKVFFEYAKFIAVDLVGPFTGVISHTNLLEQATASQLAFFRLVGCAYLKKHANAFYGQTPSSLLNSFAMASLSPQEQHRKWLDQIRQTIWDRISSENETIPSYEALHYHWLRSCWVLHMWQQAESNVMLLAPLDCNGWTKNNETLEIFWDTAENIQKIRQRVRLLMNGCGCKSGCRTGRCGCKKKGEVCGTGCRCAHCENTDSIDQQEEDDVVRIER